MEIYLIRHTTPAIAKGICYGQSDLDVTATFAAEAERTRVHLPVNIQTIYSSPLQRCRKLAEALFPQHQIQLHEDLKELHCGHWEMQPWDAIPKTEMQPWMEDFVNVPVPGGESYTQLHQRVINCLQLICQEAGPVAIVAHGGVLRSIASHITNTPLKVSFDAFSFHYGCVVKLVRQGNSYTHELLYNYSASGKEWHRPSRS
ncbi:MAG: alpha-ribazole phosphatase [Sediminibacterium sp.]